MYIHAYRLSKCLPLPPQQWLFAAPAGSVLGQLSHSAWRFPTTWKIIALKNWCYNYNVGPAVNPVVSWFIDYK